jgi:hypothetical protein
MHGSEAIAAGVWEEVTRLGADGQLLGIVSHPSPMVADRPIVILLNAGVLHRVGPHRMHVTLARQLAQRASSTLGRLKARLASGEGSGAFEAPPAQGREPPPLPVFRAQLGQLVGRGVKILAVFSGAYGDRYNHRDQLFELFPELRGHLDHEYFPAANHMFTELAAQADLLVAVTSWLTRHFLPVSAAPPPLLGDGR